MANQNFKVKNGLEVGTGVTISAGIVTASTFSGNATNATYAVTAGVSTYSGVSGVSTFSGYSNASGVSTFSGYSNTTGFSTFSGYSNTTGFSTFSGYSNASGVSTFSGYANASGVSTFSGYSNASGVSTYSGVSGVSTFSGYSDTTGFSTFSGYSNLSGISTYASNAGIATTTTNIPNLTGDITSNGTATSIASGVIVNDDINASAAIAVSKLAASTISGVTLGNNLNTLTLNTSGTGLSGSTTYNGSGSSTFTVTSNATSSNTNSTIVARDASGNFSAGTITATLSGTATQVSNTLTLNTSGTGLSGSTTFNGSGASTFTVTSNATSANTASAIVARDASGNFSAGTITAALSGNATSATNLSTNRTNWSTNGTISAVVGQLSWKNYGNNHTIFDASQGTSPDGGAVNNTNAQVAWTGTYPTLMGWNGSNTYGVRVDSARVADSAGSVSGTTSLPLTFQVNNSEVGRFDTSGNLQVANGNIVFSTAGKGIDFSATANSSGTMTSELLSDYEEGTWTPTLGGSGNTYTQTTQTGVYTKIGNLVIASFAIVWSARSGTSTVTISLPYTTFSTGTYRNGGSLGMLTNSNLITASKQLFLQIDGGSYTFANLRYSNNNATWSGFLPSDMGTSGEIQGTVTYHTN